MILIKEKGYVVVVQELLSNVLQCYQVLPQSAKHCQSIHCDPSLKEQIVLQNHLLEPEFRLGFDLLHSVVFVQFFYNLPLQLEKDK
jgi:hypothetical protein